MTFNIRDVKRGLAKDGARESHFNVEIDLPPGVGGSTLLTSGLDLLEKIALTGKASTYPVSNNEPVEVDYFGRKIKLAGNRTFEDWTVTFYNDEDFGVRNFFENWLAAINGHETNVRQLGVDETQNSYKAFGRINQFSKTGREVPVKTYEMYGMFPVVVGPMTADWGSNEVQTFDVTFSYDYWVSPDLIDIIVGRGL